MKDYYKVLEISNTASKDEIKMAFRKLAKLYHPDINKGDKVAEDKFKEISEAYEVLGNQESKRKYDTARAYGSFYKFTGFTSEGPFGNFYQSWQKENRSNKESDFINHFVNKLKGGPLEGLGNLFGNVVNRAKSFVGKSRGGSSVNTLADAVIRISLQTALKGGTLNCDTLPRGTKEVLIKPNTPNNAIIEVGPYRVRVEIEDETHFKVLGNNIKAVLTINMAQAILGSKVRFVDPRGTSMILVVPKNTKQGDKVKMTGLGLQGGDLIVEFDIAPLPELTEDQQNILAKAFADIGLRY